jgi:hypothetical protein
LERKKCHLANLKKKLKLHHSPSSIPEFLSSGSTNSILFVLEPSFRMTNKHRSGPRGVLIENGAVFKFKGFVTFEKKKL